MASNLQSDLKLLAKPSNFSGDPENWSNWKFALVNWLSLVDMEYPALMEQVSSRTTHVDIVELNAEIARIIKWLDPSARIRFEPSVVQHFHKRPKN